MSGSEFSHTVRLDTLGPSPRRFDIEADENERKALAERFGLLSIDRLTASLSLTRAGDEVTANGTLEAAVVQSCVATGEPVPGEIDQSFELLFRPQPRGLTPDEEIELGEGEMDVVFYEGAAVDIGEAAAETLSLSLDPYPRAPGADEALKAAGVRDEAEAKAESSPFAALRDKLGK